MVGKSKERTSITISTLFIVWESDTENKQLAQEHTVNQYQAKTSIEVY